jgi:uncharacterized membrane protein YagU involved in acid resistance
MIKENVKVIVAAGLLAGTLDIAAAFIFYYAQTAKDPLNVLKFIASGVFGTAAFPPGTTMVFWGLLFHFSIALVFAFLFAAVYPFVKGFLKYWWAVGLLFGVVAWVVMNLIVVPLSRTPPMPLTVKSIFTGIVILILCIGWPLAYIFQKRQFVLQKHQ